MQQNIHIFPMQSINVVNTHTQRGLLLQTKPHMQMTNLHVTIKKLWVKSQESHLQPGVKGRKSTVTVCSFQSSSRTSSASAVNTFHNLARLKLSLWYSADAVGTEVGISCLDAT
eukprot:GHVL01004366.1.p2 GENE.GHVL01004366.1~~GHVL01004366.1.p2  ORF type:complete len:114 (+),score=5.29 GHVL01004366.1:518-859(+)